MIWLVGLLLVAVVALIAIVDWHLGGIRQQIAGLGQLLGVVIERLDQVNGDLDRIARDTDKMPKIERNRFDDY